MTFSVHRPPARPHRVKRIRTPLLPSSAFAETGLFLYFPRRASQAPKLRAFIDAVRSDCL